MDDYEALRYLILAAQREGDRLLSAALRPLDLTSSQAEALRVLAAHAPLSLVELGERLICESGSPSRLVAALVDKKLVRREPSKDDQRSVVLKLTAAGETKAREVAAVERGLYAQMRQRLGTRRLPALVEGLHGLIDGGVAARAYALRRAPRS